jgi:fatty acid desaturase
MNTALLLAALGCFAALLYGFFSGWPPSAFLGLLAGFIVFLVLFLDQSTPEPDTSLPDPNRRPPDPPEQQKLF